MLPEQSIEVRHLLGWSQARLASAAELTLLAVVSFEAAAPSAADVIFALQAALEAAAAAAR